MSRTRHSLYSTVTDRIRRVGFVITVFRYPNDPLYSSSVTGAVVTSRPELFLSGTSSRSPGPWW